MKHKERIAVGLSGGVDSAVALAILKAEGYDVFGLTMKIYDGAVKIAEGAKHACYGPGEKEDIEVCERITKKLGVPYHVIDLSQEYNKVVLDYFRDAYKNGRTPNPCVMCNHSMKFGFLLSKAKELGFEFDRFATGHYANTEIVNGSVYLKKAFDRNKDQSYFLYRLPQNILNMVTFPLGGMTKADTRVWARKFDLEVADKPESQDFIAGGDYSVLFDKVEPGDIVDDSGKVLGHHNGIIHYTVGQRRGLNISTNVPMFVKEIDAKSNRVIVTSDSNNLFNDTLTAHSAVLRDYISSEPLYAKIRYNHHASEVSYSSFDGDKMRIEFVDMQRGITPGQALVLYQGEYVVGGGEID